MRKLSVALFALLVVAGCKPKVAENPVSQILELGAQAEKELAEIATQKETTTDVAKIVEFGKQEVVIREQATLQINQLLGGKGRRLAVAVGKSTDSLPVNFVHGTIGIPDFFKNEFRINLQIAGFPKRPLTETTYFLLSALDAQGNVLVAMDANMGGSPRPGDTLYAGGMFRAAEIKSLAALAAR